MANHVVKSLAEVLAVAAADGDTIYCSNPCKFYKCISDKFKVSVNATKLTNGVYAVLDMEKMADPSIFIVPFADDSTELFPRQFVRIKNQLRFGQALSYKTPGSKLKFSAEQADINANASLVGPLTVISSTMPKAPRDALIEGTQEGGATKFWCSDGTTPIYPDEIEKIEFNPSHNGVKILFVSNTSTPVVKYAVEIPAGTNEWVFPSVTPTGMSLASLLAFKFNSPFKGYKSGAGAIYSLVPDSFAEQSAGTRYSETGTCQGFKIIYRLRNDYTYDD